MEQLASFGGPWMIELLIAAVMLLFAQFGLKKILKIVRRRLTRPLPDWREKIDQIFYYPILLILWILGIAYFLDVLERWFKLPFSIADIKHIRDALILSCLSWLLLRWKKEVQYSLIAKPDGRHLVDSGVIWILGRLLTVLILIVTILLILQVLGMNVAPLLAFGGIGAAAVGFAGKDVIANFFGGLMVYITRPFSIGDQIEIPERNIEGTVEEIGWYLTAIRDKDKCPAYLPNSMFSTILVINNSRMTHRRIEERIKVRFEDLDKIKPLTEAIRKKIDSHPAIDTQENVFVAFDAVSDYGLQLYINAYSTETRQDAFLVIKQELLLEIKNLLLAHGVKMALPTTKLEMPENSSKN